MAELLLRPVVAGIMSDAADIVAKDCTPRAMSVPLQFRRAGLHGILGETFAAVQDYLHAAEASFGMVVLLVYGQLLTWHTVGNCLWTETGSKSVLRIGARRTCRVSFAGVVVLALPHVVATRVS